jgi:hypothetical protein
MRPDVGEEMSRQPSLPSLSIKGTLVRTSRLRELNNPNNPIDDTHTTRVDAHARPNTHLGSRVSYYHNRFPRPTPLTRPRSFRDAARCG